MASYQATYVTVFDGEESSFPLEAKSLEAAKDVAVQIVVGMQGRAVLVRVVPA